MAGATNTTHREDAEPDEGPVRVCAVTRREGSPDGFIRFVLGPDGVVVPDLARRLPGRGVWVDATSKSVAEAARRNVFAKSLKRAASVPENLADLVERLMRRRLADALSLANKAGLVVAGFAKVERSMDEGRAALILHAADAAADGASKLDNKFKALVGPVAAPALIVRELTSAEMSLALGRPNVVHAAAAEGGASQHIVQGARRLRRFRTVEG